MRTLFVVCDKNSAEKIKKALVSHDLIDKSYMVKRDENNVYFPVKSDKANEIERLKLKTVKLNGKKSSSNEVYYKDRLKGILNRDEYSDLINGYDILGNIAVLDIPESLMRKEKEIAKIIIESNKNVTTVVKKAGAVEGVYRIRPIKYVFGKRTFLVHYKEDGCYFEFDIRKVFFSTRLSYERKRVASKVIGKSKLNVAVPFAGVGPFAIEIAKNCKTCKVSTIELNHDAYLYMKRNIKLNKVENVKAIYGDFNEVASGMKDKFDLIIMPMPKTSTLFLDSAFSISKQGTCIVIYTFCDADKIEDVKNLIVSKFKEKGADVNFKLIRKVRTYSKDVIEIAIDFTVNKLKNNRKDTNK